MHWPSSPYQPNPLGMPLRRAEAPASAKKNVNRNNEMTSLNGPIAARCPCLNR